MRPGQSAGAAARLVAGSAGLPLSASFAELGVVDGQLLYLCDLARNPGEDATVEDISELIAGEAKTQRQSGWPRALVVMTFGLAWIAATAGLAVRGSWSASRWSRAERSPQSCSNS